MNWKKIADVAATVGKYTKDGAEKNRYINCGVILESPEGNKCIKLSCIPIKDDGTVATFLSIYPNKERQDTQSADQSKKPDEFDDNSPF